MKKLILIIIGAALFTASCNQQPQTDNTQPDNTPVTVTVTQKPAGLDLQALGELAKKCSTAKELEDKLNQPNSINDVDLDGDGNVDYLKVTEYGNGNDRGFSITDDLKDGTTQEIATISFSKQPNNQVATNISGNQTIYGSNANYQTTSLLTDLILFNYLFNSHPYYSSPYRYGYYPSYYHSYHYVSPTVYNRTVTTYTTKSTFKPSTNTYVSKAKDPNAGKSSPTVITSNSVRFLIDTRFTVTTLC